MVGDRLSGHKLLFSLTRHRAAAAARCGLESLTPGDYGRAGKRRLP